MSEPNEEKSADNLFPQEVADLAAKIEMLFIENNISYAVGMTAMGMLVSKVGADMLNDYPEEHVQKMLQVWVDTIVLGIRFQGEPT